VLSGFSNIIQNDLIEAIGDAIRYDLKEIRVDIVGPFKLPSRAGLKGRGARGNFYRWAPMT